MDHIDTILIELGHVPQHHDCYVEYKHINTC